MKITVSIDDTGAADEARIEVSGPERAMVTRGVASAGAAIDAGPAPGEPGAPTTTSHAAAATQSPAAGGDAVSAGPCPAS